MINTNITAFQKEKNYESLESLLETVHLSSIPGMIDSIKAAAAEPIEDCVPYDPDEAW